MQQQQDDCQTSPTVTATATAIEQQLNMTTTPTTSQTTPTSSTSRHYVDKARLIQLVHDNPILWDCRLPNYKRADKSKTEQWNHLGTIFNVSGERVQRTFTSLREIFRRELNNEKLLGRRFKSKWEFYKSMSFLRDVIRERKPRERHNAKSSRRSQLSPSLNNPLSSSNGIDEYQYFAPNDPNNPSIHHQQTSPSNNEQQLENNDVSSLTQNNNNAQLSVLNLLTQLSNGGGVVLASGNQQNSPQTQSGQQQSQPLQQQHQQSTQHTNNDDDDIDLVQPSPATSTTPSMYIKDEIEIPDDDDDVDEEDSTSITFNGEVLFSNNNKTKITNSNLLNNGEQRLKLKQSNKTQQNWKRNNNKDDYEDIDDIDDNSSIESISNTNINNNMGKHKILINTKNSLLSNNANDESKVQQDLVNMNEQLSSVSGCVGGNVAGTGGMVTFGAPNGETEIKYRRHLVYTKFADFIVAKMDAMNERDADDLMDRMMLVIAQKH